MTFNDLIDLTRETKGKAVDTARNKQQENKAVEIALANKQLPKVLEAIEERAALGYRTLQRVMLSDIIIRILRLGGFKVELTDGCYAISW